MKTILRGAIVCSALFGALALHAQTADEIVAKSLDAIGGKQAISQVKSITMETSVQVMGNEAPGTVEILDGVGYKSDIDFNGSKVVQCYNGKGGWSVNPMAGQPDPTPMSDDQYKNGADEIYVGGPLYDYTAKGNKLELISKDGGVYKIKVTSKNNVETTYVIDGKTYMVNSITRKGEMQGQEVDITTNFSDYQKTESGFMMPHTLDLDFGGQFQLTITVKKVELNKTIDPAIFEMPKA